MKNLTIKFSDMEKIDYREASAVNFGLFAGVNNGIITNCEVTVNNPDESQVAKATITILSMDRQTDVFNVGGFVGINNNAITNSRTDSIALSANGLVAGFACENNGTISINFADNSISVQCTDTLSPKFILSDGSTHQYNRENKSWQSA